MSTLGKAKFLQKCECPACMCPRHAALQVYTAEEKAALAMLNVEENKKKEDKILADMRTLVQRSMAKDEEDVEEGA